MVGIKLKRPRGRPRYSEPKESIRIVTTRGAELRELGGGSVSVAVELLYLVWMKTRTDKAA
jgi:hypothetical protein